MIQALININNNLHQIRALCILRSESFIIIGCLGDFDETVVK